MAITITHPHSIHHAELIFDDDYDTDLMCVTVDEIVEIATKEMVKHNFTTVDVWSMDDLILQIKRT